MKTAEEEKAPDLKLLGFAEYRQLKEALIHNENLNAAISFVNPFSYYKMIDENYLRKGIDGFFIDGMLLEKLFRLKYGKEFDRISFDYSSIAKDFLEYCELKALTISFLGGNACEIEAFGKHIKRKYPALVVKNIRNGFFSETESVDEYIRKFNPSDIVVIGMGAPLQEEAAIKFKEQKKVRLAITCGGFITQTSARADYYYELVKKWNLRWLQRLILHSHVRNKVIATYPKFLVRFLSELLLKK